MPDDVDRIHNDADELLQKRLIATLATLNKDGSIYLTAIWFRSADDVLMCPTSSSSRKARNVARAGRAALMIDSRDQRGLRGVSISGPSYLLLGDEARARNEQIWSRYLTEAGLNHPALGGFIADNDDATVVVEPERVQAWNLRDVYADLLDEEGLFLPLEC